MSSLRQALISYQDYHMLSPTFAGPRMLTITGGAGSGKTQLVKHVVGAIQRAPPPCPADGKRALVLYSQARDGPPLKIRNPPEHKIRNPHNDLSCALSCARRPTLCPTLRARTASCAPHREPALPAVPHTASPHCQLAVRARSVAHSVG